MATIVVRACGECGDVVTIVVGVSVVIWWNSDDYGWVVRVWWWVW